MTQTLFQEALPVLNWLPDETLFSYGSRLHELWGNKVARRTSKALFGAESRGCIHDLPSGLGEFVARTDHLLGDVAQIARERTLLGYYRLFLSPDAEAEALATMASGKVTHLKYSLGILTSRFRANHPLKACPLCMEEDLAMNGWPYWHQQHQFPGVWFCHKHGAPLHESTLKSTGVQRFLWHLPKSECLSPSPVSASISNDESAKRLSQTTLELVKAGTQLSKEVLHRAFMARATDLGWVTAKGNLRMQDIVGSFLATVSPLASIPELKTYRMTVDGAESQLRRLFRAPRTGTHPIRHMVMISWLFADPHDLLDTVSGLERPNALLASIIPEAKENDPRRNQFIELMGQAGATSHGVARKLGIDVATAMAWAAQNNIAVCRRPKKLKPAALQALITLLRGGADKRVAAKQTGVSVQSVTRILRTEPGLHTEWLQVRFKQKQNECRSIWTRQVIATGQYGIRYTRMCQPSVYAWLYRNDHGWLVGHLPGELLKPAPRKSPVDWAVRDKLLAAEVTSAATVLQRGRKTLKLWQLYQAVPELRAKLGCLRRLPLTQSVINGHVRRKGVTGLKQTLCLLVVDGYGSSHVSHS